MNDQKRTIKPISFYFREAVKFYDIDRPGVAETVFVLMLAVIFGGYLLARPYVFELYTFYEQLYVRLQGEISIEKLNSVVFSPETYEAIVSSFLRVFLIIIGIRAASFLISLFYGSWYFFGKSNPMMPGARRAAVFFSRLPKIIVFNILFYITYFISSAVLLMVFGLVTIFVPLLYVFTAMVPLCIMIIGILFVFKDLLIIEFDVGVFRNFKKSIDITQGNRKLIILNMLSLYALEWLLNMFSIDVNNAVLALFISAFMECIVMLITQRLTVLMFMDASSLGPEGLKPSENGAGA